MQKEVSYKGINFTFPGSRVEKVLDQCAHELEKKIPYLEKLHFSFRKEFGKKKGYAIDLRAVSKDSDVIATVQTKNVYKGLKIVKNATLHRLREEHCKKRDKKRRKAKLERHRYADNDMELKEAL